YAAVRELVEEIVSEGVNATVSPIVRETVTAVQSLAGEDGNGEVSVTTLSRRLALDKSATSRRVADAIHRGYLRNLEERRGRPARLAVGDPMPEDVKILPDREVLQRCSQNERAQSPANSTSLVGPCGSPASAGCYEVQPGLGLQPHAQTNRVV